MAQGRATARGEGYPRLERDQIDLIIGCLVREVRNETPAGRRPMTTDIIQRLSAFYIRRWGLPPSLGGQ